MRLKRVLLASSALALLAGAQTAQADGLYISVFGGANWQSESSAATLPSTGQTVDPDTGFVLGGAVGAKLTNWVPGLRAELEASYRRNDLGGNWFTDADVPTTTDTTGGPIDANISTFAVMANVWYEHDFGWKVRPYIGGGIGWASAEADGAFLTTFQNGTPTTGLFTTPFNMSSDGFAWQLGIGFNYEAAPGVDVGLGYRYFNGPDFACFALGGECGFSPASGGLENENHSVMMNLSIDIN